MCKRNTTELLKLLNPENLTITPWGYNEEEEYWESNPQPLDKWLKNNPNEMK